MKPGHYQFLRQDRVIWGTPAAAAVTAEVDRLGAARVFIVSGKTLARKTDVVERIRAALGGRFVGLFDETRAHTPRGSVIAGAAAARSARPDLIVTVGGGTPIDTVKVMLICLAHDLTREEQLDDWHVTLNPDGSRKIPEIKAPPCRQIVVGTTLSGAEYSDLGGCTDTARKIKDAYIGRDIGALSVILDAAVSVHTPDWLWLSTGIRAIDHAVEGFLSPDAHPFLDALHLQAIRLLAPSLRRNQTAPGDLEARLQSMLAVWPASSGINRVNYGASHGIGHALGGAAAVPHGYTSCVMLPAVLRYNEPVTRERQRLLSEAFGQPDRSAADCVAGLVADLGLPQSLRAVGLKREQFDAVASAAMRNLWVRTNPRPIAGPQDVKAILETVW